MTDCQRIAKLIPRTGARIVSRCMVRDTADRLESLTGKRPDFFVAIRTHERLTVHPEGSRAWQVFTTSKGPCLWVSPSGAVYPADV